MPAKKSARGKENKLSHKRLRDITWEIGQTCPPPPSTDHIALLMITPHRAHIYWSIMKKSLDGLRKKLGRKSEHAALAVRVYDVTDIIFDGLNAHAFFDLDVRNNPGNYYFRIERPGRNHLAEAGLRCTDGSFYKIARSGTTFFDLDRASGNYSTEGLFVGGAINKTFPVNNIFDAPAYEMMNRELSKTKRKKPLSIAKIFLDINGPEISDNPLNSFIKNVSGKFNAFGGKSRVFSSQLRKAADRTAKSIVDRVNTSSQTLYKHLSAAHKETPFHIVHCHDWYSSKVGLTASARLNLPMVLTLHSTEFERAGKNAKSGISSSIRALEKEAVRGASLVMVPRSSTRKHVIDMYGAHPEKVVVIARGFHEKEPDAPPDSSDVKRWFGLNEHAPTVLFAGEMSHAAGADIMVEALTTVCRNHGKAQFVFAGDGPLKGELEARAWHAGIGKRCRFVGDISSKNFEPLLTASDFVVIPARTWQDDGVARMAISKGKPVLTTHQSGIGCVKHGENGLMTFDNPGSIVWGIQELLSNTLKESMLRTMARKNADESLSFETIAARHYVHYENILKYHGASKNA